MSRFLSTLFLGCVLLMGVFAPSAQAQFAGNTPPAEPALQFGRKNPQLAVILALQNQLQLLQSLIQHETAVNDIVNAATDVGVKDPSIPPPDKEICAAVPANIPCAQAYSSLYNNYSVAPQKAEPVSMPKLIAADTPQEEPKAKKKIKVKIAEPVVASIPIYWTNITCLNQKCTAVISSNPGDPKSLYRMSAGEKLPDGSFISSISASGVTIMRNKKLVQIDPAPKAS